MIKKVLITGAAGLCGSVVSHGLNKLKYKISSCDIKTSPSPAAKALDIPLSKKIKKIDLRKINKVLEITNILISSFWKLNL